LTCTKDIATKHGPRNTYEYKQPVVG